MAGSSGFRFRAGLRQLHRKLASNLSQAFPSARRLTAMLDHLVQAAAGYHREGGRDLLHAVTDLFLLEDAPSDISKDHYSYIASQALDRMNERDRTFYARWVASEPTLPHSVARKLA